MEKKRKFVVFVGSILGLLTLYLVFGSVKVKVDGGSETALVEGEKVIMWWDDGLRCVTDPCPTKTASWEGEISSSETVRVPVKVLIVQYYLNGGVWREREVRGYPSNSDYVGIREALKIDQGVLVLRLK